MNLGLDIDVVTDSQNRFKYFFMYLSASKQGWHHCRPVIVVDGSALKAKYGGILLSTCGHDANESIFPLAFSIGDSENDASWKWFFTRLREAIGTREELTIVADRHKSIVKADTKVYPKADFGICVQHLTTNLKVRYKTFKKLLKTYFHCTSRTYLASEFHRQMGFIHNNNLEVHRYLMDADPHKWARSFFNGRRYSVMTTNIAESLNNVDLKARLMPMGYLAEWLRDPLQRWFVERRNEAMKLETRLAINAEKHLCTQFNWGLPLTPRLADKFKYTVTSPSAETWIVDMQLKTCTCRQFQVDQIPCAHVMAVCNLRHMDLYSYCSNYYRKDAIYASYAGVVHPVGSVSGWDVPEEVKQQVVHLPDMKCKPGRPRVNRIIS